MRKGWPSKKFNLFFNIIIVLICDFSILYEPFPRWNLEQAQKQRQHSSVVLFICFLDIRKHINGWRLSLPLLFQSEKVLTRKPFNICLTWMLCLEIFFGISTVRFQPGSNFSTGWSYRVWCTPSRGDSYGSWHISCFHFQVQLDYLWTIYLRALAWWWFVRRWPTGDAAL